MRTSKVRDVRFSRLAVATASVAAISLTMSACAGQAGSSSSGADAGEGVEPRADFSVYQEALADMEEVTLTHQPSAQSPETMDAYRDLEFKKNVEEASGGKITIDLVYGQAIAGYSEVDDALIDGRLDMAYTLPNYDPTKYPVTAAFTAGTTLTGASPRAEELAANAAMLDVAMSSADLIEEFESQGLHPLVPFNADGTVFAMCPDAGTAAEGWNGRQVRISSATQEDQLSALGSTPVSLEYVEIYEGLQRGVIDCTLSAPLSASAAGFMEVAPNFVYPEQASFARGGGAVVAGSSFEDLPLAAQQLIFDQMAEVFNNTRRSNINSNVEAAQVARDQGGSFDKLDDDTEQDLVETSERLVAEQVEKGAVPDGFDTQITDSLEKWRGVVEEMGLGDEGGFEDLDQWHKDEEVDLMPFSERVYEEVMQERRPE